MQIGKLNIESQFVLAPMANVAEGPFRQICLEFGAGIVFTELISAEGLSRDSEKTFRMLDFSRQERPIGIQIFGSNPVSMARAARIVTQYKPDCIDLNFGCPVKKVIKNNAGSALMKDLPLMREIVKSVRDATPLPLWCKIRSGWDENTMTAMEAAQIIQEEGADVITVHPRTRAMMFTGKSDWTLIKKVKDAVNIPVIGNGDITSPEDAMKMQKETGCDLMMIGRGAMGKPWIFQQCNHYLKTGENLPDPNYSERIDICLKHYQIALESDNILRAVREMRKHIGWYLKGMPGSSAVKQKVFHLENPDEVKHILQNFSNKLSEKNK